MLRKKKRILKRRKSIKWMKRRIKINRPDSSRIKSSIS